MLDRAGAPLRVAWRREARRRARRASRSTARAPRRSTPARRPAASPTACSSAAPPRSSRSTSGRGQLAWALRTRPARHRARAHQRARPSSPTPSAAPVDLVVADLSFISLRRPSRRRCGRCTHPTRRSRAAGEAAVRGRPRAGSARAVSCATPTCTAPCCARSRDGLAGHGLRRRRRDGVAAARRRRQRRVPLRTADATVARRRRACSTPPSTSDRVSRGARDVRRSGSLPHRDRPAAATCARARRRPGSPSTASRCACRPPTPTRRARAISRSTPTTSPTASTS